MKKHVLFTLMALPYMALAQQKTLVKPKQDDAGTAYPHTLSLQVEGGTQGVGADLRYGVLERLSVRAGACFIPVTVNNVFSFSDFQSTNNLTARFSNIHLLADFVPFKGARGFRLIGGAGYLFKANGALDVIPTGTYNYGDIIVTADQVGKVNVDVSWKGVAPYMGIGLFKSFPSHLFNFNLDLGTYYLTSPHATVAGTGLLSSNGPQGEQITNNVSDYRWLPVLQLNFNFKIK